jgi:hypothetical protein
MACLTMFGRLLEMRERRPIGGFDRSAGGWAQLSSGFRAYAGNILIDPVEE